MEETSQPRFHPDMSVGEALQAHSRAGEVFVGFQLGGCAHCAISGYESIRQICEGYGLPLDELMAALNGLPEEPAAPPPAPGA